jgi:hypothetical protein
LAIIISCTWSACLCSRPVGALPRLTDRSRGQSGDGPRTPIRFHSIWPRRADRTRATGIAATSFVRRAKRPRGWQLVVGVRHEGVVGPHADLMVSPWRLAGCQERSASGFCHRTSGPGEAALACITSSIYQGRPATARLLRRSACRRRCDRTHRQKTTCQVQSILLHVNFGTVRLA